MSPLPTDQLPFLAITGAIGAVIGAVAGGVIAKKTGRSVWKGAAIGAAGGALLGLGVGAGLGMISGAGALATAGKVVAGLATLATTAGDKITAGLGKISNVISNIGNKTTNIYRSVSQAEAISIKSLGKFTTLPGQMEVKQFGFSLQETIKFGQIYGQNIIAKASVPNRVLSQLYTGGIGGIDNPIFRSGTLTVYGDMLDAFNQAVAGSIQIMP